MLKEAIAQFAYKTGLYIPFSKLKTHKFRKELKQKSLQYIGDFDGTQYKTSDRLFILGSSYSINDVTEEEWEMVKAADSIGVNNWVFHDLVPTYYVLETPHRTEQFAYFKEELNNKADAYANVPFFVQYVHLSKSKNHLNDLKIDSSKIFYNVPFMPNTLNTSIIKKMLKQWNAKQNKTLEDLIHYSGSLSYIIMMGVVLGYKEIVLLGVDLNDNRYFFQDGYNSKTAKNFIESYKESLKIVRNTTLDAKYLLADKKKTQTFGCISFPDYMVYLKRAVEAEGVSLKIASKGSRLYPLLDYFER